MKILYNNLKYSDRVVCGLFKLKTYARLLIIGVSKTQIAMEVGCNQSSIYKEINRNTGKRGYRPKQAQ